MQKCKYPILLLLAHQLVHLLHEGIAAEVLIYDDAVLSDEE